MQLNLDLFEDTTRWPRKPYCSEDKTARFIRSLSSAIKRPYIQANPPYLRVWSIYDVDRAGGALAWEDANLPPPSWAAINKENTHAHLVWGLSAPVLVDSPDMRQAPLRYLCAVEAAFRESLQADQGYAGLITKNPAHPLWRTLRGNRLAYDLGELADDAGFADARRPPDEDGAHAGHVQQEVNQFGGADGSHWDYPEAENNPARRGKADGRGDCWVVMLFSKITSA